MKLLIFSFLIIGSTIFGSGDARFSFLSASLNDYIDYVMPAITNSIINKGLDPLSTPDMKTGFSFKPLIITYHGELELTKGSLRNLKSLRRSGDTTVSYQNRLLKIRGDFGVEDIEFDYDYLAKVMNIGPTGGVKGSLSKASFVVDILIDFNSNEIHLQDFYMHDTGKISVKLTGHILIDLLTNTLIKVITTLFKSIILSFVESSMRDALQEKINEINNSIGARRFLEAIERDSGSIPCLGGLPCLGDLH